MGIALGELAVEFGCELSGDPDISVDHVAPLHSAGAGALSFLANPRLSSQLATTRAAAVVLEPRSAAGCPVAALLTSNPHALFARIATRLYPSPPLVPGIHPTAIVDARAQLDPSCQIGPYVLIGADVVLGPRCVIGPALRDRCRRASRPRLPAGEPCERRARRAAGRTGAGACGAVIGADGFGLARERQRWLKCRRSAACASAIDVEIGANTTIDRARWMTR